MRQTVKERRRRRRTVKACEAELPIFTVLLSWLSLASFAFMGFLNRSWPNFGNRSNTKLDGEHSHEIQSPYLFYNFCNINSMSMENYALQSNETPQGPPVIIHTFIYTIMMIYTDIYIQLWRVIALLSCCGIFGVLLHFWVVVYFWGVSAILLS